MNNTTLNQSISRSRNSLRGRCLIAAAMLPFIVALLTGLSVFAEETPEKRTEQVRELFVPDSQLGAILEGCTDRTMLTREEYETLVTEARKLQIEAEEKAKIAQIPGSPVPYLQKASDYQIKVLGERALIEGTMEIEVFADHIVPYTFPVRNVSFRSATLDDQPARLGGTPEGGSLTLFLKGKGKHVFKMQMTTPLLADSTRQELQFQVPRAPQMTMRLEVPGDVELKSGPSVIKRAVEGEGPERKTKFELLEKTDNFHLVMTLNSHKMRAIRTVLVRSVQFDELTETYERLHATVSLDVLHQGIDRFRIAVPKGFEVTDVRSPMLSRWALDPAKGEIEVHFREPVNGQTRLEVAAIRNYTDGIQSLKDWKMPLLKPVDASSNIACVGLLLDARLEIGEMKTERLIPIDTSRLAGAIPASALEAVPGSPTLRFVSAWYAPQGDWDVSAEFARPEAELEAVCNLVLSLDDSKQSASGALLVTPRAEKLFTLAVKVPPRWLITKISDAADVPIPFEPKKIDGEDFVQIRLPRGVMPGETYRLLFESSGSTEGWLGSWKEHSLEFPVFRVKDTARDSGTIAVCADEDMVVIPKDLVRLIPLDEAEKAKFAAGIQTKAAFRYLEQPYGVNLDIKRVEPRLKVRTFSFFTIEPSLLSAHYELNFNIEEARTRELVFLLPDDTSETPGITGLSGLSVKETNSKTIERGGKKYRQWTVSLAGPVRGEARLSVDFEKTISEGDLKNAEKIELPMIHAQNVAWQTGLISIEGHEELDVNVPDIQKQGLRSVDIGESASADYIPGRRLIGVYDLTAAESVPFIEMLRNPAYVLTPSIVQHARADAKIGVDGSILYTVDYELKTKATFMMIDFTAGEKLWSASLDGVVVKPQRSGSKVMIDIPAGNDAVVRTLRIVYGTKTEPAAEECRICDLTGTNKTAVPLDPKAEKTAEKPKGQIQRKGRFLYDAEVRIPELMIPKRTATTEANAEKPSDDVAKASWEKVPVSRLSWAIETPRGFEVTRVGDRTPSSGERSAPRPALFDIGRGGAALFFAPVQAARESAKRTASYKSAEPAIATSAATYPGSSSMPVSGPAAGKEMESMERLSESVEGNPFGEVMNPDASFRRGAGTDDSRKQLSREKLSLNAPAPEAPAAMPPEDSETPSQPETDAPEIAALQDLKVSGLSGAMLRSRSATPQINTAKSKKDALNAALGVVDKAAISFGGEGKKVPQKLGKRLETVQPVSIDIQAGLDNSGVTKVESIGDQGYSSLKIKMVDTALRTLLWHAVFIGFVLAGLLCMKFCPKCKWRFVYVSVVLGTLLVFVPGLEAFADVINSAVFAVVLVVLPIYLLCAIGHCICGRFHGKRQNAEPSASCCGSVPGTTVAVLIGAILLATAAANAQEPATVPVAVNPDDIGKIMVRLIQGSDEKITIPADVVLVPYNGDDAPETKLPNSDSLLDPKQRVLVSTAKYKELWNLVHPPEKKPGDVTPSNDPPPPVQYSLAGAEYKATLASNAASDQLQEDLTIEGTIRMESFTNDAVAVPLQVFGGALESVMLDGNKAKLGFGGVLEDGGETLSKSVPMNTEQQQMASQNLYVPAQSDIGQGAIYLLTIQGKGEHTLTWKTRYNVKRQGGWRIVCGRLPVAAANGVALVLPEQGDELRTGNILDQRKWTAKQAGETIETTLGNAGVFHWQWRSKVTKGEVDYNLKVNSEARFDVQEDGYRITWDMAVAFGGGKREMFRLRLPKDYQVASVEGQNVRGWAPIEQQEPDAQTIDVELLKPADENENVSLVLWKNETFKSGETLTPVIPPVSVIGAAMHRGRITIQRSPLLDVRASAKSGLEQTDLPDAGILNRNPAGIGTVTESPLGIRPVQAFAFSSDAFQLGLSVTPLKSDSSAKIHSILKLSEFECKVESRIELIERNMPIFQADIVLPEGFKLETVNVPAAFEWAERTREGKSLLSIYLAEGKSGTLPIVVEGRLVNAADKPANIPADDTKQPGAETEKTAEKAVGKKELVPITGVTLPKFSLLSVTPEKTDTEFAILLDPSFDVVSQDLKGCEKVYGDGGIGWLNPEQRSLAKLALSAKGTLDFGGTISQSPRVADVSVSTISNVCVKRLSIEETISVNFAILKAGVRKVEFELPAWMGDARIECPLIQQKTVVKTGDKPDSPITVRLDLQEDVMGELRILIRNDRLLQGDTTYSVPLPKVLTGRTARQYAVLEIAQGADEIKSEFKGMKPLSRQLKEWAYLESFLGNARGAAYVVNIDETETVPSLVFKAQKLEAIQLAGARIGLSETRLAMGHGGAYRAEQVYHVDNKTEPYLDIRLPEKAEIWVVRILSAAEWKQREQNPNSGDYGEPVKPCMMPKEAISGFYFQDTDKAKAAKSYPEESFVRIPLVKSEVGDPDYVVRIIYAGKMQAVKSFEKIEFPLIDVKKNIHIDSSVVRLHLPEDFRYKFDGKLTRLEEAKSAETVRQLKETYDRGLYDRLQTTLSSSKNDYERVRANVSLNDLYGLEQQVALSKDEKSDTSEASNYSVMNQRFFDQENRKAKNVVSQAESNWRMPVAVKEPAMNQAPEGKTSQWLESNQLARKPEDGGVKVEAVVGDFAAAYKVVPERRNLSYDNGKLMLNNANAPSKPSESAWTMSNSVPGQQVQMDEALSKRLVVKQQAEEFRTANSSSAGESDAKDLKELDSLELYQQKAEARNTIMPNSSLAYAGRRTASARDYSPSGPQGQGRANSVSASMSGGMGGGGMGGVPDGGQPQSRMMGNAMMPGGEKKSGDFAEQSERSKAGTDSFGLNDIPCDPCAASVEACAPPLASRFASLDLEIPVGGKEYVFTTPRGEIELSARSFANDDISRIWQLCISVLVLALIFAAWKGCVVLHSRTKRTA